MSVAAIPCLWMRGGTSKGGFFLESDLPTDEAARDALLLKLMGSPDERQIDGMGGGTTLTSKVAIVSASTRSNVDVEYLFLQVSVDVARVSGAQNCGNILAGVAPFAIERGLVKAQGDKTCVTIFQRNSEQIAIATVTTKNGVVQYEGDAAIDGVPGTAAPVLLEFKDTAGSSCGALLPTGNPVDMVNDTRVTLIDNGMPSVVIDAAEMGVEGHESPENLNNNDALKTRLETLRLACGPLMNLGDVTEKTVPKMVLVSPARRGGSIQTRSFIPHTCHTAIGVLGAVSVATACVLKQSVAGAHAHTSTDNSMASRQTLSIEHPSGELSVVCQIDNGKVVSAAVLRTANKLMDGVVFG